METKYIDVMNRYEIKYILSPIQYEQIRGVIEEHGFHIDEYGQTSIMSVYYDTPNNLLIRTSLAKPNFKEKIRLRSYGLAKDREKSTVYLELKRKAKGLVYKRRISSTIDICEKFMNYQGGIGNGQIAKEIIYFRNYYKTLVKNYLIIYEREAFKGKDASGIRITFDRNCRYRNTNVDLTSSLDGNLIIGDKIIMEIKVLNALPIWLVTALSNFHIYKGSFSKYGTAFRIEELKDIQRRQKLWVNSFQASSQMKQM